MSRRTLFLTVAAVTAPVIAPITALAAEAEEGGALPQFDISTFPSQIFWLLISFMVLYWLCANVFLPRLGGIIEERRNRIADDFDQAADFKRQAEAAEAAYNKALADAKASAAQIAAETRTSLDKDIAEMEAETDKQLEADISAAETRIADTAAKAAENVTIAAKDTAKALVVALIDETPSDEAVDAALTSVGA